MLQIWISIVMIQYWLVSAQAPEEPTLISQPPSGGPLNVALNRPVMVSVGGTCGEESVTQANLPKPGAAKGIVNWENSPCTARCERSHPQDMSGSVELLGSDPISFGNIDCKGNDTFIEVVEDWTCYVNVSRGIYKEETYAMWLYLNANQTG